MPTVSNPFLGKDFVASPALSLQGIFGVIYPIASFTEEGLSSINFFISLNLRLHNVSIYVLGLIEFYLTTENHLEQNCLES